MSHAWEKSAAVWGGVVAAIVTYSAAVLLNLPAYLFFPRLLRWSMTPIPGEPAMRWYGWLVDALLASVVGAAIGRPFRGRPSWHIVWVLAAMALVLLVGHEWQWFTRG